MTRTLNSTLRLTGLAAGLAFAVTLFAAPGAEAGDRGARWDNDRNHRIERHYDGDREVRRHRHKRAHRHARRHHRNWHRGHRHHRRHRHVWRHHRHDHLGPVIAGIGLGILTHAILSNRDRGHYHD